jgi:hypothetical protein
MIAPDPLPMEQQRQQLCEMMAWAFIEIRMLGWNGHTQQAADLADAFHNLPREMYGWGGWWWDRLRDDLQRYQQQYGGSRDSVAWLDEIKAMTD